VSESLNVELGLAYVNILRQNNWKKGSKAVDAEVSSGKHSVVPVLSVSNNKILEDN
jgi:hypothetical protein